MKEIPVSKQWITFAFILILLAVGGWYVVHTYIGDPVHATPTPDPNDAQASAAIISGVEAFFNVDYQVGQEAWLKQFCKVASDGGCQFAKLGAASMWKRYEAAKTVTSASVQAEQKVKQTSIEQVWQLRIQLSAALPGTTKTVDTAYALAVHSETGWKFERFLMPEEIQAIELAVTPSATAKGGNK